MTQFAIATNLSFGLAVCWFAAAVTAAAAEPTPIAGKAQQKTEKMQVLYSNEASGRLIYVSSDKGSDKEITKTGLWDATTRTNTGMWDLTRGTGSGRGVSRVETEKGGDSYATEFDGVCTPAVGLDSKPTPRCYGGWIIIPGSGTGRFASTTGAGNWTGRLLSNGDFEVEWSGHLQR